MKDKDQQEEGNLEEAKAMQGAEKNFLPNTITGQAWWHTPVISAT